MSVPFPVQGSSDDVKRRIVNALFQRGVPPARKIDVDVSDGTVTLRGTLPSFYERQLCLACTQRVPGVFKLVDKIKVEWPNQTPQLSNKSA